MINTERVRLLVDALRSGDYQQGFSAMSQDGKDCPAGVACKVAIKNGLRVTIGSFDDDGRIRYDGKVHALPYSVKNWYGFDSSFIEVTTVNGILYVTELNDRERCSFDKIADLLEETYLKTDCSNDN